MSHSQEPWCAGDWAIHREARGGKQPCKRSWVFVEGDNVHSGVGVGQVIESTNPPATMVFGVDDRDYYCTCSPPCPADIARIVACVNFLAGIPTETLEKADASTRAAVKELLEMKP